jgi:hypothetical protein
MAQCAGERTDCPSVRERMKNSPVCRREDGMSQCARGNEEQPNVQERGRTVPVRGRE